VQMSLTGPAPYRARGTGSISLWLFDIDVDFDVTWGETRDTVLPSIAILQRVADELNKAESWAARLPAGAGQSVTLRPVPADAGLVLHPVGVLRVSQRAIPLDLDLARVGAQKPSDAKRLALTVAGGELAKVADTKEQFAPAQFLDMSDADKLSRPAFGPETGGMELSAGGAELRSGRAVRRTVRYEMVVIDTAGSLWKKFFAFPATLFGFLLKGGSVAGCELSLQQELLKKPWEEKLVVLDAGYTVAFQADNSPMQGASFASEASARDFMNAQLAADPALAEALHVIPTYELTA
jgi:hypothetical protein